MKRALLFALVSISTLACSDKPRTTVPTTVETLRFPSLEIFEHLNGWEEFSEEGKRSREQDLQRMIERIAEDYSDSPAYSFRERACQLLPGSMQALGDRLGDGSWTAEDRAIATHTAQLATYIDPSTNFELGSQSRPDAELQRFVEWFDDQVADPKTLGLMVATMYSGPWYPREESPQLEMSVNATKPLPGGLELELGYRDDGTWCMRGRTKGEVHWVVDLGMPADQAVSFSDEEAVDLGPYGWRLNATFGKQAVLYVSETGEALFYFTRG